MEDIAELCSGSTGDFEFRNRHELLNNSLKSRRQDLSLETFPSTKHISLELSLWQVATLQARTYSTSQAYFDALVVASMSTIGHYAASTIGSILLSLAMTLILKIVPR